MADLAGRSVMRAGRTVLHGARSSLINHAGLPADITRAQVQAAVMDRGERR